MITATKSNGSAAAGKAGETSAAKGTSAGTNGQGRAVVVTKEAHQEKKTDFNSLLSSSGVEALLRQSFAEEETAGGDEASGDDNTRENEASPGREIPTSQEIAQEEENNNEAETGTETEGEEIPNSNGQAPNEEPVSDDGSPSPQPSPPGEGEEGEAAEVPQVLAEAIASWESTGGALPPALQGLVEKRIHKITSEREQARTKVAELETEVSRLREKVLGSHGVTSPTFGNLTPERLQQLEQSARGLVADAENYLDDTATDGERARVEAYLQSERLDEKGLKRRVRELREVVQAIPQERARLAEFRKQESAHEVQAKELFPFLFDKTSAEYGEAQQVLELMPELRSRTPAHQVALGTYLIGLREVKKMLKAKAPNSKFQAPEKSAASGGAQGTARPTLKAPPKSPAGGSAAVSPRGVSGKERQMAGVREAFQKNPTRESVEALLKAELRS